jgi:outer membrane protein TolC
VSARYTVVVSTTQAFITALTQQQLVAVDSEAVVRAESQLQVATNKLRVGAATRSDSLTALVALGTARLNLVNAKAALITAQAGLARLVGLPGEVVAQDDSTFHHVVEMVDTAEIRREALAQAPSVRSADANADAAHANLRAAKAGYWPTLSASASANWSGNSSQDYHLLPNRSIGLQLSWPLFNRFVRERTIAQNQVNADVADASAQDARRALDASLSQQLAQLDAARQNIAISQTSVASAQEALRVVQERYRAGTATIVDVQVAQDALNTAEVSVLQARFAYLTAKAQIEALIGRPL